VCCGREAVHVGTALGQQHLRAAWADPGDGRDPLDQITERGEQLLEPPSSWAI
jgi:hypothetical protein